MVLPGTGHVAHRESHGSLLGSAVTRVARRLDAVIVPAARSVNRLVTAAEVAVGTGGTLVVVCSGPVRSADVAMLAGGWPRLAWVAVDLPAGYRHPLLCLATSTFEDATVGRLSDLSIKRNLGLLVARLCGWSSIMFLDDDITGIYAATLRRAVAMLGALDMVGLVVEDYPDNSVVCHANRLAGGEQRAFVSGSALLVNCQRKLSFFPEVYNEDWLFFFDSLARRAVARGGSARQLTYQPFADPGRAVAEEFGDVLAEGLVGLLHGSAPLPSAHEVGYWRRFLDCRYEFIEHVVSRLDDQLALTERYAAVRALDAAQRRLSAITPQSCVDYIRLLAQGSGGMELQAGRTGTRR